MNSQNIRLMEIGPGTLWDQLVELYNQTFTDPLEWENHEEWKVKLNYDIDERFPVMHVMVAVHESEETQTVVGGMIFEHHRSSHVGFMSYILVKPEWRKNGISKAMLSTAINILSQIEQINNNELLAFLGDSENPKVVPDEKSCMPTNDRFNVMQRLGGKPIDFTYIQPCLVGGGGICRHLMLWSFDMFTYQTNDLSNSTLIKFLNDLYISLGIADPKVDENFIEMVNSIKAPVYMVAS
jgi:GNAT superfamily N-acetyltransferase